MIRPSRAPEAATCADTSRFQVDGHAASEGLPPPALGCTLDNFSSAAIQALPAAIYATDAEGRITSYNEAAATLWGCRPEIGKSEFCGSWKLYWPDGTPLPHSECPMALALKRRQPIRGVEAVAERPDGTRVTFIPYPTPLFDASGALIGAFNMLVDVSDRKKAEQALAKHRDEQAALYLFTDRLFRASTLDEVYQAALDAIRQSLGCERASILLFDDADAMRFVAWWGLTDGYRRAVEGHSPWARDARDPDIVCIPDVDGAELASDLRATVKREGIRALAFIPLLAKGRLIGKFMTYHEAPRGFGDADTALALTIARQLGFSIERMRAEDARGKAEAARSFLASIVETSGDAIASKNLDGIVTSWNRGAERLFGYTAAEIVGRSITILIPPDRQNEEADILERIKRGEATEFETIRLTKDGRLIDISLTISPVRDEDGRVVGASKIARDITERKQAQARQELLALEIQHRTKNLFAVVHSVVARSFAGKHSVEDAQEAVLSRLRSLAQTHAMLIEKEWQAAALAEVAGKEMSPYAGRVAIEGPHVALGPKAAQNFALALHELATNAAKYGALSNAAGHVRISWEVEESSALFRFHWCERGGPPVIEPEIKGFGSVVLEQVMSEYSHEAPRMAFDARGVTYELTGLLQALAQ